MYQVHPEWVYACAYVYTCMYSRVWKKERHHSGGPLQVVYLSIQLIYVYVYTYIYIYIYIYTHIYIHTCTYGCMYVFTCVEEWTPPPGRAASSISIYLFNPLTICMSQVHPEWLFCTFVTNPTLLCVQDAISWRRYFRVCLCASFPSVFCM